VAGLEDREGGEGEEGRGDDGDLVGLGLGLQGEEEDGVRIVKIWWWWWWWW